jgi:GNAT superfamily N-acetyltransferase
MVVTAPVILREVSDRRTLRRYIHLPAKLYQEAENWVPPIYGDEWKSNDPRHNPALAHSDVVRVLASLNGQLVGRVMGIINHKHNAQNNEQTARFFQLDCIDDASVARALLQFVEQWVKTRGMHKIIGPFGFSDKDPQGAQVEGFEYLPVIATPTNPPYLPGLIEGEGYEKEVDSVSYQIPVPEQMPPVIERVFRRVSRNPKLKLVESSTKRQIKPYIVPALQLVNETFTGLLGFTPMSDQEINKLSRQYLPILDPEFLKMVIDEKRRIAGFIVAIPDISRGMKSAKGKLWPFGFLRILVAQKKSDQLDLLIGAIHPELRGIGIDVLLGKAMIESAMRRKFKTLDSHLVLETNRLMCTEYQKWGGKIYKRYRVYRKFLR